MHIMSATNNPETKSAASMSVHAEMLQMINDKRLGREHATQEINWLISSLDYIQDYQLSSWLMAVCLNGLTDRETADLTQAMAYSGQILMLKESPCSDERSCELNPAGPSTSITKSRGFVDKHSTGGVGDKVSLVLGPLLASVGFKVSKFSGRALGHTGGTVDKLEAIPGFRTDLDMKAFEKQVMDLGIALAGQTMEFAPADKRLYSLRDKTGTVESIPLIASSVMSKKIAAGADSILLDVKVGAGAFMKNLKDAEALAKSMKAIGDMLGKNTKAVISNMDQPLGWSVGNSLELEEALQTLKGENKNDFYELTMELCETLVERKELEDAINSGKAYVKFSEFVEAQGGDMAKLEAMLTAHKTNLARVSVQATEDAYVKELNALEIGLLIHDLAYNYDQPLADGRPQIDNSAGLILHKRIGDKVSAGELIFELQGADSVKLENIKDRVLDAYLFSKSKVNKPKLVYKKLI